MTNDKQQGPAAMLFRFLQSRCRSIVGSTNRKDVMGVGWGFTTVRTVLVRATVRFPAGALLDIEARSALAQSRVGFHRGGVDRVFSCWRIPVCGRRTLVF